MNGDPINEFIEKGAHLEHERWAKWQKHLHSKMEPSANEGLHEIGSVWIERWERQIATPYSELSEEEKESDREQVRPYLPLLSEVVEFNIEQLIGNYMEALNGVELAEEVWKKIADINGAFLPAVRTGKQLAP